LPSPPSSLVSLLFFFFRLLDLSPPFLYCEYRGAVSVFQWLWRLVRQSSQKRRKSYRLRVSFFLSYDSPALSSFLLFSTLARPRPVVDFEAGELEPGVVLMLDPFSSFSPFDDSLHTRSRESVELLSQDFWKRARCYDRFHVHFSFLPFPHRSTGICRSVWSPNLVARIVATGTLEVLSR